MTPDQKASDEPANKKLFYEPALFRSKYKSRPKTAMLFSSKRSNFFGRGVLIFNRSFLNVNVMFFCVGDTPTLLNLNPYFD
jgi:hypothetical protein